MTQSRRARTRPLPPVALVGTFVLFALLLAGCSSGKSTYVYQWNLFFDSIFHPDSQILGGLFLTVVISVAAQFIGVVLGIFAALGKMSRARPIRWFANVYVWVFRGT